MGHVTDGQPVTVLVPFLGLLVRRLLLDDVSRGMVERSSSALLPLIVAEPAAFQRLGDTSVVMPGSFEASPAYAVAGDLLRIACRTAAASHGTLMAADARVNPRIISINSSQARVQTQSLHMIWQTYAMSMLCLPCRRELACGTAGPGACSGAQCSADTISEGH